MATLHKKVTTGRISAGRSRYTVGLFLRNLNSSLCINNIHQSIPLIFFFSNWNHHLIKRKFVLVVIGVKLTKFNVEIHVWQRFIKIKILYNYSHRDVQTFGQYFQILTLVNQVINIYCLAVNIHSKQLK